MKIKSRLYQDKNGKKYILNNELRGSIDFLYTWKDNLWVDLERVNLDDFDMTELSPLCIGRVLLTKDGTHTGNGIIYDITDTEVKIVSDFGNVFVMPKDLGIISGCYYLSRVTNPELHIRTSAEKCKKFLEDNQS